MRVCYRFGTISTTLAGDLTGSRSLAWWVDDVVPPVGRQKVLFVWVFIVSNGSLDFPTVDVVPVSLTPDAIVPLLIPWIRSVLFSFMQCRVGCLSGLSTVRLRVLIVTYCAACHNLSFVSWCDLGKHNLTMLSFICCDVCCGSYTVFGSLNWLARRVQ